MSRRVWTQAIAKVLEEGQCRNCGASEILDPAHVIPRSRIGTEGDDPRNIITLCRLCHQQFDHGTGLDVLPLLSLAEQSYIAGLVGIAEAYRRATGSREVAA
jgi:5-methylcytosine-specific restriction endonuclease McrA